jgi:hypothetical protein
LTAVLVLYAFILLREGQNFCTHFKKLRIFMTWKEIRHIWRREPEVRQTPAERSSKGAKKQNPGNFQEK